MIAAFMSSKITKMSITEQPIKAWKKICKIFIRNFWTRLLNSIKQTCIKLIQFDCYKNLIKHASKKFLSNSRIVFNRRFKIFLVKTTLCSGWSFTQKGVHKPDWENRQDRRRVRHGPIRRRWLHCCPPSGKWCRQWTARLRPARAQCYKTFYIRNRLDRYMPDRPFQPDLIFVDRSLLLSRAPGSGLPAK